MPIVISNATVPILGVVDTGVVGQMGQAAPIGAVGVGAIALTAIYWIFGFLRMGTAGLGAQAKGAEDAGELSALLSRALLVALGAGLVIVLLQMPLIHVALQLAPASGEVERLAQGYMSIRIFSAPAMIGVYALTGWLIAMERTGAVLAVQVLMNGLNIVLDIWFVLGLGWGVNGVAFATFLAEWGGFALALWLCRAAFATPGWRDRSLVFDPARLLQFATVNRDILLRSVMLQAVFLSFMFLGAGFGDATLAANQVLIQLLFVASYALDGFAIAAESLVGQGMGAKSRARVRRAAWMTSLWGAVSVVLASVVFLGFGGMIIDAMTTSQEVRAEARLYLLYMIAAPVLGCAAWMLDGIFIGATRSRDMRNMMAVSFVIYAAALALLIPPLGNHGLWLALLVSFVARGITLALRYPALERAAG